MNSIARKQLLLGSLLIVLAAIPATLFLSQQSQETRSRATASTRLYYTPSSTTAAPVQKNVGETISFDVMVDPGSNLPSVIKLALEYDATKFQTGTTPFVVNMAAFPTTIEGPVLQNGKVLVSVSIGSDATKAIQSVTKIGTLTLTALAPTTTSPTVLSFGSISQVLSLATKDQANENVLSTTTPAYVNILATATPTLASTGVPTITTATGIPTPLTTLMPSGILSPTQIQPTQNTSPTTMLSFTVFLHGIGNSGDNANPTASDLSNKTPIHPDRNVLAYVYNDQNQLTATRSGTISYNQANGNYKGGVDFGNILPAGDYTIRLKDDTHLRRLIPGIRHITPLQNNVMPDIAIVAGDVNNDNILNILDYNILVNCYSDLLPAVSCTDSNKRLTDLNDDGHVNQIDYNLFLREITVQSGN